MAVMTLATEPISTPCATALSPESAKNSMKTKITAAAKSITIHTDDGMTPAAPCVRSRRATSRSDV